jgi:hypothetical protein
MSVREKVKLDIDTVLDEMVNAETIEAINDTEYNSYDSFDDLMKHIDEIGDEDKLEELNLMQAIEDSRNGNVFGPFDTVEEAMASLLQEAT